MPEPALPDRDGRWAVYYVPPPEHALWQLGCRWLGRDPETGDRFGAPDGIDAHRWAELVRRPAHYGFHATLKPPMPLREGADPAALRDALADLARGHQPFALNGLRIGRLDRFYALLPDAPTGGLEALAADCVRLLDGFRDRAASAREETGLTPRQLALARRWGYPYVFDEFRFHMTLTAPVEASAEAPLAERLAAHFDGALHGPVPIDAVALFHQPDRATPFRLVERAPLGG